MNTVTIYQRNIYLKRPENNCKTVKIINEFTKIYKLFKNFTNSMQRLEILFVSIELDYRWVKIGEGSICNGSWPPR